MEPSSVENPQKKIKLTTDNSDYNIEKDAEVSDMKLEAVLAEEYTRKMCLEWALVAPVLNKKYISHIIKELSVHLPIPRLQHLKRVKNDKNDTENPLSVLLCLWNEDDHNSANIEPDTSTLPCVRQLCPAINIPEDALGPTKKTLVSVTVPLTREQFDTASFHWPTNFHEDKYISRLMSDDILSAAALREAERFMNSASDIARKGHQLQQSPAGCSDGCVIVDPASGQMLASSHPVTDQHPLHHAVMVAVDLVARGQGGGTYTYPGTEVSHSDVEQSVQKSASVSNNKTGPYLCTGYDVYSTYEPCAMCTMALVHSRIRRLYYGNNSPDGALGTKYKIHVQPGLNHHFEVFKCTRTRYKSN